MAGTLFGLIFVKQGNPAIFASLMPPPTNLRELLHQFWPIQWGYLLLLVLGLATVLMWLRTGLRPAWSSATPAARRCLGLAAAWFVWQLLAATATVRPDLTQLTLMQFAGCLMCLAFGLFVLRDMRPRSTGWFWGPLLAAFGFSLWVGWDQRFGGLEAIRREVLASDASITNGLPVNISAEALRQKALSDRIYGTFVYPNAFAGGILLMLPVGLAWIWTAGARWRPPLKFGMLFLLGGVAGACLVWSGSKSAWLLSVVLAGLALAFSSLARQWKIGLALTVAVLGLSAFGVRYAGYFQRGATSVEARFDYWRAAIQIAKERPLFGTGPGTFQVPYARLKDPGSEMARLAHNDYLEQASDSGWIGFGLYLAFILTSVWVLYRQSNLEIFPLGVLLGWTGLQLQSLSEFNLYIPGLAWTGFLLLGWLLGRKRFDTPSTPP